MIHSLSHVAQLLHADIYLCVLYQALQKHSAYRPSASVLSDPKAWWHYVIAVTLRDVRERRGRWGLRGLTHRRHVSTILH
jgi:Vacuolar sorting-associated protein 13, N-terminal